MHERTSNAVLPFWTACWTCFFHFKLVSTCTLKTLIVASVKISLLLNWTVLIRSLLRFCWCFVRWISWYLSDANLALCFFAHAMHWLWAVFSHLQFVCADSSHVIRFVSFTKSNIIVLLSECSNIISNSDIKNKKRIEEREELCEISALVSIHSLSNSEKIIFVHHSVKKH